MQATGKEYLSPDDWYSYGDVVLSDLCDNLHDPIGISNRKRREVQFIQAIS